jgi:argininosuccinate lyase
MTDFLWSKSNQSDRPDGALQQFLSGDDLRWDRYLFEFDIAASQAHARGLQRIGILSEDECTRSRRNSTIAEGLGLEHFGSSHRRKALD